MAPYTGRSRWDQYQAALKRHPHRMQILQAVTLSLLGNVCNQYVLAPANHTFNAALVVEQVSINIIISPVTIHWFRALERWRLHWVVATLADQLIFNVVLNARRCHAMRSVPSPLCGCWSACINNSQFAVFVLRS